MGCKALEPGTRCLFETLHVFLKAVNIRCKTRINKARGLLTIDFSSESAMEKRVFDIQLMNRQGLRKS
jgi:hypothetical protein